MPRSPDKTKFNKRERVVLQQFAREAWNAELGEALTELYEEFGKWADDAMDAMELSDKIHEFHNGVSRELYGLYTSLDSSILVSRAVALGFLEENAIGKELLAKLKPEIEWVRKVNR